MLLPVSPVPVNDFSVEYGSLDCNVEVVDSLQDAVQVNDLDKVIDGDISYSMYRIVIYFVRCADFFLDRDDSSIV